MSDYNMTKHTEKIEASRSVYSKTIKITKSVKTSRQSLREHIEMKSNNLGKPLIKPKPTLPPNILPRTMSVSKNNRPPILEKSLNLIKESLTVDDGTNLDVNCLQKNKRLYVYLTGFRGNNSRISMNQNNLHLNNTLNNRIYMERSYIKRLIENYFHLLKQFTKFTYLIKKLFIS